MSSPVPSKPPSRRPISSFGTKPKEAETKEDKQLTLRLKSAIDNIFEPRATNSNPLGIPDKSQMDDSFQDVKHKEHTRKPKTIVNDYSKDLSDHESESEKST